MSRDRTDFAARSRAIGVSMLLGLTLAACATSRSVVDVQPPVSRAAAGAGLARISEVRDLRKFEVDPRDPSVPSLGDVTEVADSRLTARALARKRNTYGKALGDVVLPEGSSVASLVRGAAAKALQDAGYTVVDEKSPDYAKARPLAIEIQQFWAWITPGFAAITIDFDSQVVMKGDALVGANAASARGTAHYGGAAVFESDWSQTITDGLGDLTDKMRARIRAPGAAAAQPERTATVSPPPAPAAAPAPAAPAVAAAPAATTPVPASVPAAEFRRTGVLANDIEGRWIGYIDYSIYSSPTAEQQQALLNRCGKYYSTFKVERSKFVVEAHQDADVHRREYAISSQRPQSLVYNSDNSVRGARFTNVSFDKDRGVTKFGLAADVLVFEARSAGTQSLAAGGTIKYARCPSPQAPVQSAVAGAPVADARVAQAESSSSAAVAMVAPPPAPTPPAPRTGGIVSQLDGRWISYADYATTGSLTTEQQQALLSRCSKSYSTFIISGSKLIIEGHSDTAVRRTEYSISRQRPDYLLLASSNSVRDSAGFTNVSFGKDRMLSKFGLPTDVLVFEPRTPQGGSYNPFAAPRNYARCPAPAAQ